MRLSTKEIDWTSDKYGMLLFRTIHIFIICLFFSGCYFNSKITPINQAATATPGGGSGGGACSGAAAVLAFDSPANPSATYPGTADVTYTITNSGSCDATGMTFSGLASPFAQNGGTCGTTLAASSTCTYIVRFTSPGQVVAHDTIVLDYNDGTATQQTTKSITGTGSAMSVSVAAVYVGNSNWNYYVKNDGADIYNATNTACGADDAGYYSACIHGGEKRKVIVTGVTSCSNLTISEYLDAFDWTCSASSGTATFYTSRLKSTKRLADLVNAASWKNNYVTVYNANYIAATSTSTTWWTNTVGAVPSNPLSTDAVQTLSTAGKIYTISSSTTSSGYNINADRIGLTTLSSSTLSYSGRAADNCNDWDGTTSSPDKKCLISVAGANFAWIEGNYNADGGATDASFAVKIRNANGTENEGYNRLTYLHLKNATDANLRSSVGHSLFDNVITEGGQYGIWHSGDYATIKDVRLSLPSTAGIYLNWSVQSIISGVVASNSINAVEYGDTDDAIVTKVLAFNGQLGLNINFAAAGVSQTISHLSFFNNNSAGVWYNLGASGSSTVSQMIAANSFGSGMSLTSQVSVKASQIALAYNANDVEFQYATNNNSFLDNLLLDPTPVCTDNGGSGANLGLVPGTCSNQGSSTANQVRTLNLASSFVGKVTTNDFSNTSDSSGSQSYGSITDWVNFENFYRGWGMDGSAFPNNDHISGCTSGTCRIWDWRLKQGDTQLLNRSNDGSTANAAFVAGSTCPAAVHGNKAITDSMTTAHTYLINAMEILFDPIRNPTGNNNGLCESGEACIYSPNFGAYQGEGVLIGPCTFTNGTVTGVSMYAYSINGVSSAGSLDTSFGTSGETNITLGADATGIAHILMQTDGKVIAVGEGTSSGNSVFKISRFNLDGTADSTFNGSGSFNFSLGSGLVPHVGAMALQRDGKFLVAGTKESTGKDFLLVRFNSDGTTDTNFGTSGVVTADSGGAYDALSAVAVQNDGKIIVGGAWDATSNGVLMRYHPDGTLDSTFGTSGATQISAFTNITAIALQSDGNIVVTGEGYGNLPVARVLTADGSLDTSFNSTGVQSVAPVTYTSASGYAIAVQTDGKIVVGGIDNTWGVGGVIYVVRLSTSGSLDTSFNTTGKLSLNVAGFTQEHVNALTLLSDGRILIAGDECFANACQGGQDKAFLIRLTSAGSYDTSFATSGLATLWSDSVTYTRLLNLELAPDGRYVVGGSKNGADTTILRLWP